LPANSNSFSIAYGSFVGGGRLDLVVANGGLNTVSVLLQNP
jgi:hypothetical protein